MLRRILTVLGVATLLTVLAAVAPVQVSAAPEAKTVSTANGWEYVSAEQNALDQQAQRVADRFGMRKSPYNGCPDYKVCLWQWVNFGGDRWESTLTNLWNVGCISLNNPVAYWDNGTLVNDNSGSMGFNNSGGAWGNYRAYMYNWAYCNGGGGVTSENLGPGAAIYGGSLHGGHWWYHKITSLELTYSG